MTKFRIAVLLTCHNRKSKTLSCLESLYSQNGIDGEFSLDTYLVDDGSTDGTTEAVERCFCNVNVIEGNGSLYWNQGMRLAWSKALESKQGYDYFLWVNDDVYIYKNAIYELLNSYRAIVKEQARETIGAISGTMADPQTGMVNYGGKLIASRFNNLKLSDYIIPNGKVQRCDVFNGNLVLIPSNAVNKVGILSDHYTHGMGDFDYGYKLKRANLKCYITESILGECESNKNRPDTYLTLKKRISFLNKKNTRPNSYSPGVEWVIYSYRNGGKAKHLLVLKSVIRLIYIYLIKIKNSVGEKS